MPLNCKNFEGVAGLANYAAMVKCVFNSANGKDYSIVKYGPPDEHIYYADIDIVHELVHARISLCAIVRNVREN